MYAAVKHLHIVCVTLSGIGFALRGFFMLVDLPLPQRGWIRMAPHVIDSVLLAAATTLVMMSGQYPFIDAWVTAKVFGLIAYIILGSLALKSGRTKRVRIYAWLAAVAVFANLVVVALTKNPWGLVSLFGG